jgi:putative heme-binding domain-containing protein
MDRVDGRHIGQLVRDSIIIRKMLVADINKLYANTDPKIINAITKMIVGQKINQAIPKILNIFTSNKNEEVKSTLLVALDNLNYPKIDDLVKYSLNDSSSKLRTTAISLIKQEYVNPTYLQELSDIVFDKGAKTEQQQLINLLKGFKKDLAFNTVKSLVSRYNDGKLPPEIHLEFFEAVDSMKNKELTSLINRDKNDPLAEFKEATFGGDFWAGYGTFFYNGKAQCVKCHKVDGQGSNVGPDLSKIGSTLSREQILAAIITPSARLAPGYGTITVNTKDGRKIVGVVMEETPSKYVIKTSDAEPLNLKKSDVASTEYFPSAMPAYGKKLKKSEIRDLVEYLSALPRKES